MGWRPTRPGGGVARRRERAALAIQTFTALDLANGAESLLDEVASKKITGEEDGFSHTDLSDLAAIVDGCKVIIHTLQPAIDRRDPALGPLIDKRVAAVDAVCRAIATPPDGT